jgi:serine/threonine-protein kinase
MRPRRATDPVIGDLVAGRYRILARLGSGGMGAVYRAEHIAIGRQVALKLLEPALRRHSTSNLRMAREAFAAGRVDHPNCVTVSDCGALEDGSLYIAMELLEGRDLAAELAASGPMPVPRALRIARHVLAGLAHAHEVGVVHRDIKPSNILLIEHNGDPDFAKVVDFGIAKLVGEARSQVGDQTLTADGLAIGSPTYMSPEQALGGALDGRTDLYALTVVLFEMITGRPPFDDEDKMAVVRMHIGREPPRLAELAPGVALPNGLEQLVARGLAKERGERIATAGDYLAAIDQILSPAPALAPAARPRRGWGWAAVGTLGLLGLIGIGAAASGSADTPGPSAVRAAAAPALAAAEPPPEPEPDPEPEPAREPAADEPDPDSADGDEPAELVIEDEAPLVDGRVAAAIVEIEKLRRARRFQAAIDRGKTLIKSHPKVAAAHLAYGHIYFDRMWWSDGFAAYEKALAIDSSLASDSTVIGNAIRGLSSRSRPWLAERFIRAHLGAAAIEALEQTASTTRSKSLRQRARRLAGQLRKR